MKTLADLKRDLGVGKKVRMVYRWGKEGKEINSLREVERTRTNGVKFRALDGTKAGWLDYPKASLLEYDGKTIKIYLAGFRNLTEEEQKIIAGEPHDEKQEEIDMISDGSTMFYRKKHYYTDIGKYYLFGTEEQDGKRLTHKDGKEQIQDNAIKGELILRYEVV